MKTEYIALVLFQFVSTSDNKLYEEVIIQVKANSEEDAKSILENYIKESEHEYKNSENKTVRKELVQIIDIAEVLYPESNSNVRELYSRHFNDFESYKKIETLIK